MNHENGLYFNTAKIRPLSPSGYSGEWGEHFQQSRLGWNNSKREHFDMSGMVVYTYANSLLSKPREDTHTFLSVRLIEEDSV